MLHPSYRTAARGPNWNFFGIYEFWDVHKVVAANNVNLSQIFWELPGAQGVYGGIPKGGDAVTVLILESPGLLIVVAYFVILPPILRADGCCTIPRVLEPDSLDGRSADQDAVTLDFLTEVHRRYSGMVL